MGHSAHQEHRQMEQHTGGDADDAENKGPNTAAIRETRLVLLIIQFPADCSKFPPAPGESAGRAEKSQAALATMAPSSFPSSPDWRALRP